MYPTSSMSKFKWGDLVLHLGEYCSRRYLDTVGDVQEKPNPIHSLSSPENQILNKMTFGRNSHLKSILGGDGGDVCRAP